VSARDEILARIRGATSDATTARSASPSADSGARSDGASERYRTSSALNGDALLDLLAERLTDYRAIVQLTDAAGLTEAVSAALTRRGARRIAVPAGLELPGMPEGVETVTGDGLAPHQLDELDGVVTGAAAAIAETGTLVLDASPGQGSRGVTLVPDYHLCIVHANQVVHLVPEAVARLAPHSSRPLTWISGPSATSDIELIRVEGVHGPRTLEVIIVRGC
jgi:L-lactate dehydrogenase complex protein LldG